MRYNRKTVVVTESADHLAISVADMKRNLRESGSANDAIIDGYIEAATEVAKEYTRRALRTETMIFTLDGFVAGDEDDAIVALGAGMHEVSRSFILGGDGFVDLPFTPTQSVTSVKTFDRDNVESTFDAAKYGVDLNSGRVYLHEGEIWPVNLRAREAVKIEYVAGWGSGSIPMPIIQGIIALVQSMYEGCGMAMSGSTKSWLDPYRRMDQLSW